MPDTHQVATEQGFHEIQLSGKQLVFLFMATTVVSIGIFLCGVLVGRGVRAEKSSEATSVTGETSPAESEPAQTPTPSEAPPTPNEGASQPSSGSAGEQLTYTQRLQTEEAPPETLKPSGDSAPPRQPSESRREPPPQTDRGRDSGLSEPPGTGFAVQVAALRERGEAEAIARRLSSKGYPAYIIGPSPGGPASMFRVRVGKYQDRREAEQTLRRLEREEQFKPWITR